MIIGLDMGHSIKGLGGGAVGYVKETDKNREVGKRLIKMLEEKGHTVVNCSVDYASDTNSQLAGIVKKEKARKLDWFLSLHLNAFDGKANGVETYVMVGASKKTKDKAKNINDNVANAIGWYNRGVKESNLYVLKNTNSSAMLIELGFCDNKKDMDKWDTEKIAKAIFKGLTGEEYIAPKTSSSGKTLYYRVVCGSYTEKANAEKIQKELKDKGFNSFLDTFYK